MIQIEHLQKRFGTKLAVDIDQLHIAEGEIIGLVGNNGAGKTTLLRLLTDLLGADQGTVRLMGQAVCSSELWKKDTGCYIDHGFLIDYLTPTEYFQFIGDCRGISKVQIEERMQEYSRFMGGELTGTRKYIDNLSEGNKQKVGIIGALLPKPRLVLLDEPFNYLDPSSQVEMMHLLRGAQQQGSTILLSSHNVEYVTELCTRVVLMEDGRILQDIANTAGEALPVLKEYFGR